MARCSDLARLDQVLLEPPGEGSADLSLLQGDTQGGDAPLNFLDPDLGQRQEGVALPEPGLCGAHGDGGAFDGVLGLGHTQLGLDQLVGHSLGFRLGGNLGFGQGNDAGRFLLGKVEVGLAGIKRQFETVGILPGLFQRRARHFQILFRYLDLLACGLAQCFQFRESGSQVVVIHLRQHLALGHRGALCHQPTLQPPWELTADLGRAVCLQSGGQDQRFGIGLGADLLHGHICQSLLRWGHGWLGAIRDVGDDTDRARNDYRSNAPKEPGRRLLEGCRGRGWWMGDFGHRLPDSFAMAR